MFGCSHQIMITDTPINSFVLKTSYCITFQLFVRTFCAPLTATNFKINFIVLALFIVYSALLLSTLKLCVEKNYINKVDICDSSKTACINNEETEN